MSGRARRPPGPENPAGFCLNHLLDAKEEVGGARGVRAGRVQASLEGPPERSEGSLQGERM